MVLRGTTTTQMLVIIPLWMVSPSCVTLFPIPVLFMILNKTQLESNTYRVSALNGISRAGPVNPSERDPLPGLSATLMCCGPCPRLMAHFTLHRHAESRWSGPSTGALIGQPLPMSEINNPWMPGRSWGTGDDIPYFQGSRLPVYA